MDKKVRCDQIDNTKHSNKNECFITKKQAQLLQQISESLQKMPPIDQLWEQHYKAIFAKANIDPCDIKKQLEEYIEKQKDK